MDHYGSLWTKHPVDCCLYMLRHFEQKTPLSMEQSAAAVGLDLLAVQHIGLFNTNSKFHGHRVLSY